jgi:hypothetical protein
VARTGGVPAGQGVLDPPANHAQDARATINGMQLHKENPMFTRTNPPLSAPSIVVLVLAGVLCPLVPYTLAKTNQDPSQLKPGGSIRTIDVKLGKNPGGQIVARAKPDADGNFTFGVLPKGSYILTLELRPDPNARSAAGVSSPIKYCYVTIKLPGGKKKEMGYDFTQNRAFDPEKFDPAKQSSSKTGDPLVTFDVESDGTTPCEGAINTSRSNIKVAQRRVSKRTAA